MDSKLDSNKDEKSNVTENDASKTKVKERRKNKKQIKAPFK